MIPNTPLARQQYSRTFKRQIVEQSLSLRISIIATEKAHGINANLLHKWCWFKCQDGGGRVLTINVNFPSTRSGLAHTEIVLKQCFVYYSP
jgi:transposase-like protein